MCRCSSLCAGAGPTSYHLLGTLWVSFTAYSVRERVGELRIEVEAARRAKATEEVYMSILSATFWRANVQLHGREGEGGGTYCPLSIQVPSIWQKQMRKDQFPKQRVPLTVGLKQSKG